MSDLDAEKMRFALERLNQNRQSRILAPLVHRSTFLRAGEDGFRYVTGKVDAPQMTATIAPADVDDLLARDLIELTPGGYRISAAGRGWLKRALSPGDVFQAQHSA